MLSLNTACLQSLEAKNASQKANLIFLGGNGVIQTELEQDRDYVIKREGKSLNA